MDFAFDHPLGPTTSAMVRGELRYFFYSTVYLNAWLVAQIHGIFYQANAWGPGSAGFLAVYEALVAATNSSSLNTRFQTSRKPAILPFIPRHSSNPFMWKRTESNLINKRDPAPPQFDFGASTIAIACSDGIDTPQITTKDAFNEIILAAATSSQMIGPEWFATQYCHR